MMLPTSLIFTTASDLADHDEDDVDVDVDVNVNVDVDDEDEDDGMGWDGVNDRSRFRKC